MTDDARDRPAAGAADRHVRSYPVAYREVWEAALALIGGLRGWTVVESDSRAGTIRATSASLLGRRPLPASVRLWLDELGQTMVEIRFEEARHPMLPPAAPARGRRFLRRLDRRLSDDRAR